MDAPLIFVLGGDPPTHSTMRFLLEDDGCEVVVLPAVDQLMATPRARLADLIVIISGPRVDGVDAIAMLHQAGYYRPTLLLTRNAEQAVRRRAFALGVLDIIGLPASPRDLRARLRAALGDQRRAAPTTNIGVKTVRAGGLTLHIDRREVSDGTGWRTRLTAREAAVLYALMNDPGRPLKRQDLLDQIWGESYDGDGNTLEVYVRRLRAKLTGATGAAFFVRTLRGQGYFFDARHAPRNDERDDDAPHILLINDTGDAQTFAVLQEAGYSVIHEIGTQAVITARRLLPLAIIIDSGTADAEGIEVHRRLRADPRTSNIPIIASGTAPCLRAHWADIKANDYLTRPYHPDELLLRVERLIGRPLRAAPAPRSITTHDIVSLRA